jgi:predicted DNA-binding WGR domain protein
MTSLHILLEARSVARRCWRAYEIDVGTDLFGAWLVEMSYGRIGAMGRTKFRSFATAADAQAQVHACLRKRARAPRRIGVAYRLRRAIQFGDWSRSELDDPLHAWFDGPDQTGDLTYHRQDGSGSC